jgi:hypothetical protein
MPKKPTKPNKPTKPTKPTKPAKPRKYKPRKPKGPASSNSGPLPRDLLLTDGTIRERWENGCSMRRIARDAGCHHVTIANRLRSMGAI